MARQRLAVVAAVLGLVGCGDIAPGTNAEGFVDGTLSPVGSSSASGQIRVSERGRWVQITLLGVPNVAGKVYEGWLMSSAETRSVGWSNSGAADPYVHLWRSFDDADALSFDRVLVTREDYDVDQISAGTPSADHVFEGSVPRP